MIGSKRHSQYLPQCAFSGNDLWPRLRAAFSNRRKAVSGRIFDIKENPLCGIVLYKVGNILFFLVPYIALRIVG